MSDNNQIVSEIAEIKAHLDAIAEHMAWAIMADQRFRVGDRVEWSRKAKKQGLPRRKIAIRGTVKAVNSFTITVKLDGLKKEQNFHHCFFNSIHGEPLF